MVVTCILAIENEIPLPLRLSRFSWMTMHEHILVNSVTSSLDSFYDYSTVIATLETYIIHPAHAWLILVDETAL